jgi:hypothetical protein
LTGFSIEFYLIFRLKPKGDQIDFSPDIDLEGKKQLSVSEGRIETANSNIQSQLSDGVLE